MKVNKKIVGITGGAILVCSICIFGVIAKATDNPNSYAIFGIPEKEFAEMPPEKQAFEKNLNAIEDSKKYTPLPL